MNSSTDLSLDATSPRRDLLWLVPLGCLLLGLSIVASRVVDINDGFLVYLLTYFAMGIVYVVASYFGVKRPARRGSLWVMVGFAIAMRVSFLTTEPVLSDDIFRYVWDGRVQKAGINPYLYPPAARELSQLRDPGYESINNKDISTIYPPLMEIVFLAVVAVSESLLAMRLAFVVFDLALLFLLIRLLEAVGHNPMRALIYAWSPLVIVEISGSGHNDILVIVCLLAANLAIIQQRPGLSISLVTLSGLAKLVGFALSPLFFPWVRPRAWLLLPLLTAALTWPYVAAGRAAFVGIDNYARRWRWNDSLFHVLSELTGSLETPKFIVAGALMVLVVVLVVRRVPPLEGSYLTLGAILLLTTTVHPWYLVWIVPYLCLYPNPAWMLLTVTVALSYHGAYLFESGQVWEEQLVFKLLEYVPFYILLGASALKSRVGLRRSAAPTEAGAHG